jgi:hypothetical protein
MTTTSEGALPIRPPYKGAKLSNLHVYAELDTQVAFFGDFEGHRYHIWVYPDSLELKDPVLYKNPTVSPGTKGFFLTRRLSPDAALGRWIIHSLFEAVKSEGLVQKALVARSQEQVEAQARVRRLLRCQRIEQHAEALYDTLRTVR